MTETTDRIYYYGYIVNEEGEPLKNVDVRIYLDNTTTEANIFTVASGGSPTTSSTASLETDNNGFFKLWFANSWETGGYDHSQLFRIEWYEPGITLGAVEHVNPWPAAFKIDITDTDTRRNKFISNYYGKRWEDHVDIPVPSAADLDSRHAHDLEPVDRTSTNNRFNKVVSDLLMKTIYDNALSASSINLSGNVLEYEEIISSWTTSSGTYYKDINHNLSRRDVSVQVLDYVTRNVDQPSKIIETDSDNLRLFVNENKTFVINVHAESISSSTSSSSSSTPVPLP